VRSREGRIRFPTLRIEPSSDCALLTSETEHQELIQNQYIPQIDHSHLLRLRVDFARQVVAITIAQYRIRMKAGA
jgi:hypothetical protein